MNEKSGTDQMEDVVMPGFRFHPTDEELVGFYLKKKIQQRPLPIELIKQVDIYKYDPWDLPKLSSTGEKEWYFYCPRDRKYRNSARPNRVTGAGFWKATGTDRPIHSSDGTKCIGLKKSLVFYRGRAAKGLKTDWMMHEFRLPSISDPTPLKKIFDKNIPPNDSWAICRIFKKTNSMAQKALSHYWETPIPDIPTYKAMNPTNCKSSPFSLETFSCTNETGSSIQSWSNHDLQQISPATFSALDIPTYKAMNPTNCKSSPFLIPNGDPSASFMFSPLEMSGPTTATKTVDVASMLFNMSPALTEDVSKISEGIDFEGSEQFDGFSSLSSPQDLQGSIGTPEDDIGLRESPIAAAQDNNQWCNIQSIGFPFSLPSNLPDSWKANQPWNILS